MDLKEKLPTVSSVNETPEENAPIEAPLRWIRPPRGGEPCPFTGMRHAAFYREFVGNPRIRQARMGEGRRRGTRLLWLPDVFAEIMRLSESQRE